MEMIALDAFAAYNYYQYNYHQRGHMFHIRKAQERCTMQNVDLGRLCSPYRGTSLYNSSLHA